MLIVLSVRVRSLYTALALASVLLYSNVAIGSDKCGSLDRAMIAIRFVRTLYPEVKGREFSLQFSEGTGGPLSSPADVRTFFIVVDKPQWHPPVKSGGQPDITPQSQSSQNSDIVLPLYLSFSFLESASDGSNLVCRPLRFMNNKMSKQTEEARTVLNAHPEWTDAEELEEATKLGMRFGSDKKAAVLKLIPWKELSTFYGPLQILGAKFSIYGSSEKRAGGTFAELRWYIYAKKVGTRRQLQITVDPFAGKIDGVSESMDFP